MPSKGASNVRPSRSAGSIHLKRVYERPSAQDGMRVLVDRLWPRGLTKERAAVDVWAKDIAPSTELRKWFGHDPDKWMQFQIRYRAEVRKNKAALDKLMRQIKGKTVTLLYGARDQEHNEAVVVQKILAGRKQSAK